MPNKLPTRDPIGKEQRRNRAQRRVGFGSKCAFCGESAPRALIPGSDPMICEECNRKRKGQSALDQHHVAGRANHDLTIPVPANDHREILTPAMYDWRKKIRENPDGSPLLAAAGCILGFCDTVIYLMDELLRWIAEMLERLDAVLIEKLGDKYWESWHLYLKSLER